MSTVPHNALQAIDWVETRVPVWSAAGLTIGLDPLEVADLGTLLSEAKDLKTQWLTAQALADAKGADYRAGVKAMRAKASGQVTQIRGFARSKGNPDSIFTTAQIPLPADPGPSPAPGTPEGFTRQLLDGGGLRFTFTCDHPAGVKAVTYKVERQQDPQGPFEFLLNAKKREFEDSTFLGTSTVIAYRVTAQTTTKDGLAASFTVRYGAGNQSEAQQATIIAQGPAVESEAS
ncbi:MAG: hypothetical protein RIE32_02180 [Phycisphaerales bacterium]